MTHPNFLLIGAQKAGTTALYHYLRQHPEVYMPEVKEPGFFAFEGEELNYRDHAGKAASICSYTITDPETYRRLFDGVEQERAVGEATTLYLHSEKAMSRIRSYVPDARLIAVLRHPVDRAYSAYMHAVREGREPIDDFEDALQAETRRVRNGWGFLWRYDTLSRYAAPVRRYLEAFEKEQVRFYLFDEFVESPKDLVQDLYAFLGCDPSFEPDTDVRYNASGTPKHPWLDRFLGRRHAMKEMIKPLLPASLRRRAAMWLRNQNLEKSELAPTVRRQLTRRFENDVLELQTLLNRDLHHWLPD